MLNSFVDSGVIGIVDFPILDSQNYAKNVGTMLQIGLRMSRDLLG